MTYQKINRQGLLFVLLITVALKVLGEPTDFQQRLINEPISMHDFMIYKSDVNFKSWVRKHLDEENWIFSGPVLVDDYEWIAEPKNIFNFRMPLDYVYSKWHYDFENANYIAILEAKWSVLDAYGVISGGLNPTISNAKKICQALVDKISINRLEHTAHEGYSYRQPFSSKEYFQNLREHVYYRVELVMDVGFQTTSSYKLVCESPSVLNKSNKVTYSFEGEWDTLDKIVQDEIIKLK